MLHSDGNVDKKFQHSIFYRSRENHVYPKTLDIRQMDISNYKVALLLKNMLNKTNQMTNKVIFAKV